MVTNRERDEKDSAHGVGGTAGLFSCRQGELAAFKSLFNLAGS